MPAPSITPAVTRPTNTLPAGPSVLSWYARKNAIPSTRIAIPILFSQSVPTASSTSSPDLNRSNGEGLEGSVAKAEGSGGAVVGSEGSGVDNARDEGGISIGLRMTHASGTVCDGVVSTLVGAAATTVAGCAAAGGACTTLSVRADSPGTASFRWLRSSCS